MALIQSSSLDKQQKTRSVGRSYQSLIVMLIISLLLVGTLGSRLAYLQLVEGKRNRELAEKNRIRLMPKQPERGNIFDRKGRILASSRLARSVYLWPRINKEPHWLKTRQRLAQILDIPETDIQKRVIGRENSSTLIRIARDISPEQITALEESRNQLEGVSVDIEALRMYPNGELAAHVLGYTGELSDIELYKRRQEGYRIGDIVGQMGAEYAFEPSLRGTWGGQQVEVDGRGQIVRILGEKPSKPGKNVQLTLDLELQKAAEAVLGENKGSIVAIDPRNGAILAMVSRPAFDPNIFSSRIKPETWKKLQAKDHPFVNRALQAFPPASTFKIVTTTAGLESGKFSPNTVLQTYPAIRVGGIWFADWNRAGFGPLGFVGAMKWSSDTFFYQVGMRVGGPTLIEWTRKFGFGKETGCELKKEEVAGLVPDNDWKLRRMKYEWTVGDTVNMSIGQGFLQTTPLQVAVMFAVPANGGYRVQPHILKDNEEARSWRESLNMKPETVKILQEGLRATVTNGTGRALNVKTIPPAAGKSGTSEVGHGKKVHTWFGAYAPEDKPEIVVVAFGEHSGGGGGSFAAPKVLKVLEAYFNQKEAAQGKAESKEKEEKKDTSKGRRQRAEGRRTRG
ncbi:penicillin-binding protein 2 [Floridanema evergladense]|uniref:Penicillin-binding protein 2 n=1 Tax=Floridaenema evergladense BLCC-F167 TaxID=3153639 RepID=A0ABV4WK16_9CYAN